MGKWKLRACPRCDGDLYMEEDIREGWREKCLQCGYTIMPPIPKMVVREMVKKYMKEVKI